MTEQQIAAISAGIALLTVFLLYAERKARRAPSRSAKRTIGVLLALASIATYLHFLQLPGPTFYHRWEMFHYFLGSKYAPELEYTRLYSCTAIADAETGNRARVEKRRMRNLVDDSVVFARSALEHPEDCTAHFAAARWQEFKQDVAAFRQLSGSQPFWESMQLDHGYNPSPVWTLVGHALTAHTEVSDQSLSRLAWIDPVLMVAAVAALWWGFGARSAVLATVFWGTQAPSTFAWTGGAFLRQDWLLLCVIAVACLRKRRPFAAGFALTWAAWLRLFPALLWSGIAVLMISQLWRKRNLSTQFRRMMAGAIVCTALLVPATWVAGSSSHTWVAFAERIHAHAQSAISNHMSLRTLIEYSPGTRMEGHWQPAALDPGKVWSDLRTARFARYAAVYWLMVALLLAYFARTIWQLRTPWLAACLSLLLIMVCTDPSSYYFSLWLIAAPVCLARPALQLPYIGLAAAGQLLSLQTLAFDDRFFALAVLYLVFSLVLVCVFARPFKKSGIPPDISPSQL
ncbi:MAG TPA: hypothetical protein VL137_14830 [Polyangiaceae bacterium]|nr:hypothetical protein [Polyangiaceae bacterium]